MGNALFRTVVRRAVNSLEKTKQAALGRQAECNEPGDYFSINPVCFNAEPRFTAKALASTGGKGVFMAVMLLDRNLVHIIASMLFFQRSFQGRSYLSRKQD